MLAPVAVKVTIDPAHIVVDLAEIWICGQFGAIMAGDADVDIFKIKILWTRCGIRCGPYGEVVCATGGHCKRIAERGVDGIRNSSARRSKTTEPSSGLWTAQKKGKIGPIGAIAYVNTVPDAGGIGDPGIQCDRIRIEIIDPGRAWIKSRVIGWGRKGQTGGTKAARRPAIR